MIACDVHEKVLVTFTFLVHCYSKTKIKRSVHACAVWGHACAVWGDKGFSWSSANCVNVVYLISSCPIFLCSCHQNSMALFRGNPVLPNYLQYFTIRVKLSTLDKGRTFFISISVRHLILCTLIYDLIVSVLLYFMTHFSIALFLYRTLFR